MLQNSVKRAIKQLRQQKYVPLNHIELSRTAVLHNLKLIQNQHPDFGIMPVLKANAYGHGLPQMAEILNDFACSFLAVDGYFEAGVIRHITRHPLLAMGYIRPENIHLLDTRHCSFVAQDTNTLEAFGRLRRPVRIHLELNTGMNRLGLQPEDLDNYLDTLARHPNLMLEGVMSHLADADNELDNTFTARQAELFDRLVEHIHKRGFVPDFIHLAQTAGSTKITSRYANSMRLGIGLYGFNPLSAKDKKYKELQGLKPVLSFKSTIIKVIELKKGDRVSYNGIFTAPRKVRIGVLPVGYYEGLPRAPSNSGTATFQGRTLEIVGRICMNHTMINLEDTAIKVGSEITVISSDPSHSNSVDRLCREHDLFSYSFVTGLASTTRRIIV